MTWVAFTPVLQVRRLGERTCVIWRDKARIRTESFFIPNMLESSVLCLAFLLFAKEENWKQLQHLWVEEKLNKVVSGIQGRLHLHQLEGMCRNEEKMPEMYQVRKAGTGCVRLGSSGVCGLHTLAAGKRKVLVTHPWGEEPGTWGKGWWQGGADFNLAYFVLFASFYNEHGFLL